MADTLTSSKESSSTVAPQAYEEAAAEMRSKGYRRVTRWVLDLSHPVVLEEHKRQLALLAEHQRNHPDELIELTEEDVEGWV
jgi:hypothetical protein